jgi:hypothetical protein
MYSVQVEKAYAIVRVPFLFKKKPGKHPDGLKFGHILFHKWERCFSPSWGKWWNFLYFADFLYLELPSEYF